MPSKISESHFTDLNTHGTLTVPAGAASVDFILSGKGGNGGNADVDAQKCGGGGGGGGYVDREFLCSPGDTVNWSIATNGQVAVNVYTGGAYKGCAASCGGDGSTLQGGFGGPSQGDPSDANLPSGLTKSGGNGAAPGTDYGGGGGGGARFDSNGSNATNRYGIMGGGSGGGPNNTPLPGTVHGGGGGAYFAGGQTGQLGAHPDVTIAFYTA